MKTTLSLLTIVAVAAQLALPLQADDEKPPVKDRTKEYPADSKVPAKDSDSIKPEDRNQTYRPEGTQPEAFGVVTKAKGIMGMEVKNGQNEKLGKVEDVAVSFSSGRVVAVIVSVGGLLGIGDTLIAVPPSEFTADADGKTLHLNRTKDELKNAPRLDVAKWDEFHKPENLAEVYRYYGVRPYFHDDTVNATDPKARNRIDTPTALQQGNSPGDLNTTAQIRKDLLKRKDLSTSAHNVTVITRDGQVTLRGTVDSEDEKRIVADIAKSAATPTSVDNQLEVSRTTNK